MTDVELEVYDTLTLIGCEVYGVLFKVSNEFMPSGWSFCIGEAFDDDETLLDYLLYWWITTEKRFTNSALSSEITDDRVLNNMVGMYYNSQ